MRSPFKLRISINYTRYETVSFFIDPKNSCTYIVFRLPTNIFFLRSFRRTVITGFVFCIFNFIFRQKL